MECGTKAVATYFDLAAPKTVNGSSPRRLMARSESTGILEQYVRLIEKEQEVQDKMEKTIRMRSKHRLSLRLREMENETNEKNKNKNSPTEARKHLLKSRNKLLTKTWDAAELDTQLQALQIEINRQENSLPRSSLPTARIGRPTTGRLDSFKEIRKVKRNPRQPSETLQRRLQEAEVKQTRRTRLINELAKDCQRAEKLIEQMKLTSTRSSTP